MPFAVPCFLGFAPIVGAQMGTRYWSHADIDSSGLRILLEKRLRSLAFGKAVEALLEAAPSLLLTSFTIVRSLVDEQEAVEVTNITYISFAISVAVLTHAFI